MTYFDGDSELWGLDADLACLSVIFSWHAPIAREIALCMEEQISTEEKDGMPVPNSIGFI